MKRKNYQRGTDSVPAKLTPREAVLNRNAAELLGRHNIAALNAHGNMLAYRGIDLPSDPTPGPSTENMLGYQRGTNDVEMRYIPDLQPNVPMRGHPRSMEMNLESPQGIERNKTLREAFPSPWKVAPYYGYQMGSYDIGDDRGDLMRDTDATFYGGGQAPAPTPTPTPVGRGYAYGTEDVRRRRPMDIYRQAMGPVTDAERRMGRTNGASRIQSVTFSRDALRGIPSQAGRNISANFPQGQVIQSTTSSPGGGYGYGGGTLPPDQNPAYQKALLNNPTPASRSASNGTQSPASFVGKYRSDYGPRAVVSTGTDTFRTYNPEGGYIVRTGNAANFLNKQFNADTSNAAPQAVAPIQPTVATSPTSLTVNATGFQPSGLEANPFTEPTKLELQPRRYSDYY